MNLENLSSLLAVLIALSVAAERLIEILKNISALGKENPNPTGEALRKLALQLLAIGAGILTAYLSKKILPIIPNTGVNGKDTSNSVLLLLGVLASGGSAFWTSILGYVKSVKDIKKTLAVDAKVQTAARVAAIARGIATPASDDALVAAALSQRQTLSLTEFSEKLQESVKTRADQNLAAAILIATEQLNLKGDLKIASSAAAIG